MVRESLPVYVNAMVFRATVALSSFLKLSLVSSRSSFIWNKNIQVVFFHFSCWSSAASLGSLVNSDQVIRDQSLVTHQTVKTKVRSDLIYLCKGDLQLISHSVWSVSVPEKLQSANAMELFQWVKFSTFGRNLIFGLLHN